MEVHHHPHVERKRFKELVNTIKVQRSMLDLIMQLEKDYKAKSASLLNLLAKEYKLTN